MKTVTHPITKKSVPACLAGVIVPMFTPANADGSLDIAGLKAFTRYFAENPYVTSVFCRCGLGKMYTYSYDDVKTAIDVVVEGLDGKKNAFFGTFGEFFAGHWAAAEGKAERPDPEVYLRQSIELTAYAEKAGAAASVLVVPCALEAADGVALQKTIFEYYRAVREAVDIPLIIYNSPGLPKPYRTTPTMVRRLCKLGGFIGMKLSSDNMKWMSALEMASEGSSFSLIAGAETTYYHALHAGVLGVIGQGAGINPEILRAVYDRFMAGDYSGALQAQYDTNRVLDYYKGVDASLAGLGYIGTKGVAVTMQPRTKNGPPPSNERLQEIVENTNRLCEAYRA